MARIIPTVLFAAAMAFTAPVAEAQQSAKPSPAQSAQQDLMRTCNATASGHSYTADARKGFMSACLSGKSDQTTIMKACNAQAAQNKLAGDERKSFMGTCLKSAG